MRFSVVMASLLADYPNSATKKDAKFIRAIESVLSQKFKDFELIIIADGCKQTKYLVNKFYKNEVTFGKMKLLCIERNQMWTNNARNMGIIVAEGDYIIYIDNDDTWKRDHLTIFNNHIKDDPWYYSNDGIAGQEARECEPGIYGKCGTSNICHKRSLNIRWEETGYGHDFHFINQLIRISPGVHVPTAGYVVARHVPAELIIRKNKDV